MHLFNRLPGFARTPPGVERAILCQIPTALWSGTLLLCLPSLAIRAWTWLTASSESFEHLTMLDMYAAGAIFVHWNVLLTAAIAASIVMAMKGPAYVADAYPLPDSDAPPCKQ